MARLQSQNQRLPDAELELMKLIWHADGPVTSADLMERLKGHKTWGVTTVLNLLGRLCERGFLCCEKRGRFNEYHPLVEEQTYLQSESRSFLERLHGNSFRSLVASLYEGHTISEEDLEELAQFIEENTKEG